MTEREQTWHEDGGESVASDVTRKVRAILDAAEALGSSIEGDAERRAHAIIRDAERRADEIRREADSLVEARARRLSELSDAVTARAEATLSRLDAAGAARAALDRLLGELAETRDRVAAEAAHPHAVSAASASDLHADSAADAPYPDVAADRPGDPFPRWSRRPTADGGHDVRTGASGAQRVDPVAESFDGPRQVAMQMAVAGSSRAEVAAHLRRAFRLAEPHVILNEVFGAEAFDR